MGDCDGPGMWIHASPVLTNIAILGRMAQKQGYGVRRGRELIVFYAKRGWLPQDLHLRVRG